MVVAIGLHGMDEAQFIDMLGRVGHELTDPHSRLTVLFEREGAFENQVIAAMKDVGMAGGVECVAE
jgi:hypothetical protein